MPTSPDPRPWRRRGGALLLALAVLSALGFALWSGSRRGQPLRVLLVVPPPDPEAEMSHPQARAIALLVQDALEARPDCAVTLATEMPERPAQLSPGQPWLLLKFQPRRRMRRLAVTAEWAWGRDLDRGAGAWTRRVVPLGPPEEVLPGALEALPLPGRPPALQGLLPGTGRGFWNLVQAGTLRLQNSELGQARELAERVTLEEPALAQGWWMLGSLRYRALLNEPARSGGDEQQEILGCFRKGEALVPGHPRGAYLQAQFLTNSGAHREALDLLLQALGSHPRSPVLCSTLVYGARNAGLLDLARAAADRRDRWSFPDFQPISLDILYLYLNEWPRFEATLADRPGHLRNSTQRFYRGYLALLRNRPAEAEAAFREAEAVPRGFPQVLRLARGYRLAVAGDRAGAVAELRGLEQERLGLRVPDGEFTLRLAEGFAAAGDLDGALELANRAFAQGFGATLWYERSPLLEPLRRSPRWPTLIQHLRERQVLLEARYPVSALPPD